MKNNKRKYINTIVVTMLSLSTMLSPITSIHANETKQVKEPAEATTIKQPAPVIELPQDVSGEEGQKLQDITLPEHWTWVDDQLTLTKDTKEYPAKVLVDDVTYDYSTTQGYNAEGHYVEVMIPVIVNEKEIEQEPIQETKTEMITSSDGISTKEVTPNVIQPLSEPEPQKATNLQNTVNDENVVEINETTFPDPVFRDYVSGRFDVNPQDSKLSRSEIELATIISMNTYGVSSFKGIEYLTDLEKLYCAGNNISSLDVSENKVLKILDCNSNGNLTTLTVTGADALEELHCYRTGITSLHVSENKLLKKLYCYSNGNLTSLILAGADKLEELYCYETGITSLDVSENKLLNKLWCEKSRNLTSLTVAGAVVLEELYCHGTAIISLDISGNKLLKELYCYSNGNLTSLIVSGADALETLKCYDTNIKYLNVSKNQILNHLDCEGTNLIGLNVGKNSILTVLLNNPSNADINIYGTSINMVEAFKGFDYNKITDLENANMNKNDGILSVIDPYKPVTYRYNSGESEDGPISLNVTLNFNYYSGVTIANNLHYTGKPVDSKLQIEGSTKAPTIRYQVKDGENWIDLNDAPVNVGNYRILVDVPEEDVFQRTEFKQEFVISKANNELTGFIFNDLTYGEELNIPKVDAKFGDITLIYSDAIDGTYTKKLPTQAGTYYVKASVPGSENYLEHEEITSFTIHKAKPAYDTPKDISVVYGNKLSNIELPNGFQWKDETLPVGNVGTQEHLVTFIPTDTNNYETINDIKVNVNVTKATNSWIEPLSIDDWTYGEQANDPHASAEFGDVVYTYSDAKDGDYTITKPHNAGTYYVKASVKNTSNYDGLEEIVTFEIKEPNQPIIDEPSENPHGIITGSTLIENGKDGIWEFAGNYQELAGISLDGKAFRIEPINKTSANLYMNGYTDIAGMVKEGSVKITLYYDFLKTLTKGSHALEVKFETNGDSSYGETSFEINIKDEPIVEPDEPKDEPKDEPEVEQPKEEPEKEQPKQEAIKLKETKEETKPQVLSKENKGVPTGDHTQTSTFVLLGLMSIFSVILITNKYRRKS